MWSRKWIARTEAAYGKLLREMNSEEEIFYDKCVFIPFLFSTLF
jgi:hypothetical protein